jgi:signal transduction histidine kinase
MDHMSFRRKINLLALVPAVAVIVALVPIVSTQVSNANQWSSAAAYLNSTKPISKLLDDLTDERQLSVEVINGDVADQAPFNVAITATNQQAARVRSAFGGKPPAAISTALAGIDELSFARYQAAAVAKESAAESDAAAGQAEIASDENLITVSYGTVITDLVESMDLAGRAALGGPVAVPEAELDLLYETDLAENQREAALVAFAQDVEGQTSGGGAVGGPVSDLDDATNTNYAAQYYTQAIQDEAIATAQQQRFDQVAPAEDLAALNVVYDQPDQQLIDGYQNDMINAFQPVFEQDAAAQPLSLRGIGRTDNIVDDYETLSVQRSDAEQWITARITAAAQAKAARAGWMAFGLLALAFLILIALVSLSVVVRRSIMVPMLRLTRAASRVAQVAQTDLERVADDDLAAEETSHRLEMVDVGSRDEIGDLARAFNQLQISAVQVLERQVAIRRNTAEMFGNMGRRIHNLTGRQLSLIDQVERGETDPVLLDRLYRIDHLAVRLQRGADSLMLLSGEQEPDLGAVPMRLTDVARSAIGRVEGYHRVVLSAEGDGLVEPSAIGDLTLLLSELVENAVTFSPAYTMVEVSVHRGPRAAILEIVDHGIGLAPYRIAEENEKLIHRERLDLVPTKVLGLFVVGRLARRNGVRVGLSSTVDGGLTARVTVGEELLLSANAQVASLPPRPPTMPGQQALTSPLPEPRTQSDQLHRGLPARRRMELPSAAPVAAAPAPQPFRPIVPAPPTVTAGSNGGMSNSGMSNGGMSNGAIPHGAAAYGGAAHGAPATGLPVNGAVSNNAASNNGMVNGAVPNSRAPGGVAPTVPPAPPAPAAPTGPAGLPRRSRAPRPESAPDASADRWTPAPATAQRTSQAQPAEQFRSSPTPELDAEAARSAIEEFESGVELALRASTDALPLLGRGPAAPPSHPAEPVPFGASDTTDEKGEQR